MLEPTAVPLLSASTLRDTPEIQQQFVTANPFRHAAIENFFNEDFAEELVAQFPPFSTGRSTDEYGQQSKKASFPILTELGPAYQRVDSLFASREFLDWASEITQIPNLIYDPQNFGGGTHENLEGQELLPHVDFNYLHPRLNGTAVHRRVNLIVYLNHDWRDEWGGAIQLHSNPRDPETNRFKSFSPTFNRCVVFETNEYSWHGFDRIKLPPTEKGRSRKSLSLYLYTTERPAEETFAPHGTFYIPRPLPKEFVPGKILTSADVETLRYLIRTRDDLIGLQQRQEADRAGKAAELAKYTDNVAKLLAATRVPLLGYAVQVGEATGVFPDHWCADTATLTVQPKRPTTRVTLRGRAHEGLPEGSSARLSVNDELLQEVSLTPGEAVEITGEVTASANDRLCLQLTASHTANPAKLGLREDKRDLSIHLYEVVFEHAAS